MDVILGARRKPPSADVWTELRDWLATHEVEVPKELPKGQENGRR